MNCKYCGAGLPTKGGHCPECGRMIPISQQKQIKEMIDPRWNDYRNKDTAYYKSTSNNENNTDAKIGKIVVFIVIIILVIILMNIFKGA